MDEKMNEFGEADGQLPTINWFLSLPNLLSGECQKQIFAEENKGRQKRQRPSSCQHSSGHLARKRVRICNSAKANLLPKNVSNSMNYGNQQNIRPPFSNVQLAIQALKNCPQQSGTLNDILAFLSTKFEYFRNSAEEKDSLKNSIRHTLTQNNGTIFKKINSSKNGRNAIWTLASNSNETQKCERNFSPKIEEKTSKNWSNELHNNYAAIMPNSLSPIMNVPEQISPNFGSSSLDNFEGDQFVGFGQFSNQLINDEYSFGQQSPPIYQQDFGHFDYNTNFIMGKEWDDDELFFFNSTNLL